MQFTKFLFDNYKESKKGRELIDFFSNYKENLIINTCYRQLTALSETLYHESEATERVDDLLWDCKELIHNKLFINTLETYRLSCFQDFEEVYRNLIDVLQLDNDIWQFRSISHCLYFSHPQYCFPYFFDGSYYRLHAIFEEFGIYSPPIPKRKDFYGIVFHYVELCRSLYDFRIKFKMNEYELPAFLYGFAPNVVREYDANSSLPEPKHVRFHIIAQNDFAVQQLDIANDKTVHQWSGSEDTQPGDIIINYCGAPRSSLHSIWRAITPGFLDPFFHWYKSVYIAHPIKIEPITIKEMRSDDALKDSPFIKMSMQGANGKPIKKVYYDRILEMLAEKGMTLKDLPTLDNDPEPDALLKNEKDVEIHLLEPLLLKLGYKETDWKRQMKLRMGRSYKVYPDYVIFPVEDRNNESGYYVWEAKLSILNNKQLLEAFGQVKSYAR